LHIRRIGYRDGFAAGEQDKANGIDKNACDLAYMGDSTTRLLEEQVNL